MRKNSSREDFLDFNEDLFEVSGKKPMVVEIPFYILSNISLSLNEKLIYGLDYSFAKKLGFNIMSSKDISQLLNIHQNIVGKCRKNLIELGFLRKDGRKYFLEDKSIGSENKDTDRRNIVLPIEVYSTKILKTGEKLLWGEYNSISKGTRYYFAKREYTANRLGISVESVSKWSKSLYTNGFLDEYELKSGYCTHQRKIITCRFERK